MTMFLASALPAVAVAALGWAVAVWARSAADRSVVKPTAGHRNRDAAAT